MESLGIEKRLDQFISVKTGGVRADFADMMGWSRQYLNKLLKGESIGLNPIIALTQKFPELNVRWLLTGEGSMLETGKILRQQLVGLLQLDKYVSVMSPEEIAEVEAGRFAWNEEKLSKWATLKAQKDAERNAHFEQSYNKL